MKNLYIFNESRRGSIYGVGTYIHELIAALQDTDININVVNLLSEKPQIQIEIVDSIRYWHIPNVIEEQRTIDAQKIRKIYYCNVIYLLNLHIEDKSNLIFHLNYNQCESFVEELKKTFNCKIISVVHFSDWGFKIYDNLQQLRDILNEEQSDIFKDNIKKTFQEDKLYYSKVDRLICLSNYMYQILCQDYGLESSKICIIPNGLHDIPDTLNNKKSIRRRWYIQRGEKIILFAGRIDEIKGVNYLIKAFRETIKRFPRCRLIVAGGGEYDKCFSEAKGIYTKITFTGLLEKKDLYDLYCIADIGVVPSLFEPFGYVAVEMMIHKLPIIVTATSGLNEIVDDNTGLKVPLTRLTDTVEIDTSLLAEKIMYLIQNPSKAKDLGRNGRKRYLREYSSEVFRKNMINLYASV